MVLRPQWEWLFADADGSVLDRPVSGVFTTRFDAEEWLGAHWRAFAEQGVATTQLLDAGTPLLPVLDLQAARAASARPEHPAPPVASDDDA